MPRNTQDFHVGRIPTGEGAPSLESGEMVNGKITSPVKMNLLGPAEYRMQAIAGLAKEDAEIGASGEYAARVKGGEWRATGTKEGRRALAGDMGLPNTKKKQRK